MMHEIANYEGQPRCTSVLKHCWLFNSILCGTKYFLLGTGHLVVHYSRVSWRAVLELIQQAAICLTVLYTFDEDKMNSPFNLLPYSF